MGSGGHAKVVLEAVLASSPDRRVTVLDDDPIAAERSLLGVQVSGTRDAAVALGIGDNSARLALLDWLVAQGRAVETVIHPSAIVGATVVIGDGAFLAAGSIAIADTTIGRGAILNTGCSVDHDCVVGDGVHIGPGVRLCGNVSIGTRSLIGVGSAIRPRVTIGSDVVVGAGSAVVADIPDGSTYAGCPARALG